MGFKLADKLGYKPPILFEENKEAEYYEGGILYNDLIKKIKKDNHFYFDYKNFISDIPETQIISPDGIRTGTGRYEDQPLYIKDKDGVNKRLKIKGRLNTQEGQLDIRQNKVFFGFKLDVTERKAEYKIRIKYRFNDNLAVELTTFSYSDFSLLSEHLIINLTPKLKELIINQFIDAFRKVGDDIDTLDWLYENVPDFVLKKLTNSVLWQDLIKLLKYDKNKWFVDSSNAMIKAIRAIVSKEGGMKFLYGQFESNPFLTKEIYHFLDKSQQSELHDGVEVPNKTIFASLLTQIVNYKLQGFQFKDRIRTDISFKITEGYRVDSNVRIGKDKYKDQYDLTQQKAKRIRNDISTGIPGSGNRIPSTYEFWQDEGETYYVHPLDIVTLIMEGEDGQNIALPLPAILVKNIAHQREWEEIQFILRIGIDILAIVLGVIVLTTSGNPGVIALAIADIGLAGTDVFVQMQKDALMQTKEGQEFLRQWEQIYTIGGLFIAAGSAPQLIRSILSLGGNLYRLAKGATREFLKNAITKIILEINIANFTGSTVKFLDNASEVVTVSKKVIKLKKAEKLQRLGVLFVEGTTEAGQKQLGLLYKGEVIATGTGKQLKETLKNVLKHGAGEDDIVRALDRIVNKVKLLKLPINTVDQLINFLGKIDDTFLAVDLERVGIKALFRGTTKNTDGSLFKGNTNSQLFGLSTSTDPIRAIIFGIESATEFGGKGFLQIMIPKNLKNINLEIPNIYRYSKELEVIVKIGVDDLSKLITKEIPINKARSLARKILNVDLDTKILRDESTRLLEELTPINLEDSFKFYEELLKL